MLYRTGQQEHNINDIIKTVKKVIYIFYLLIWYLLSSSSLAFIPGKCHRQALLRK